MMTTVLAAAAVLLAVQTGGGQGDVEAGRGLFNNHCARCHGIGGTGGEGPSLAHPALRHAADDEALFRVIQNGIEGTEMPETWQLSESEIRQIVVYVRTLGKVEAEPLTGDRERGRAIFEGKGTCTLCHVVAGEGGILGPELSGIGLVRGASHLRESLVSPGASVPPRYLPVRAVTGVGVELRGIRLNEDSFTLQLRDETGRIHSLNKIELKALEKKFGESLMPSFGSDLSDAEIDDLVAYLASLRGGK